MVCAFCKKDKNLCNSHIIPEFLWGPLYDTKHRTNEVSVEKEKLKLIQKGLREKLLCKACEGRLSRLEGDFNLKWKEVCPDSVTDDHFIIKGLNYSDFKLFLLSILWRASVASRPEFEVLKLGKFEEQVRQMILAGDPGKEDDFGIMAGFFVSPVTRQICKGIVAMSSPFTLDGHEGYAFIFGGVRWQFIVSDDPSRNQIPYSLKEDGTLVLLCTMMDEYPPIMDVMQSRRKKGWDTRQR